MGGGGEGYDAGTGPMPRWEATWKNRPEATFSSRIEARKARNAVTKSEMPRMATAIREYFMTQLWVMPESSFHSHFSDSILG